MIRSIEENDVQDKMRFKQTDSDEVSSKYCRFDDILSCLVTTFRREQHEMEIWLECYNYEIEQHNIKIPIRINDPPFAVQ